jgi:hypothetical protein
MTRRRMFVLGVVLAAAAIAVATGFLLLRAREHDAGEALERFARREAWRRRIEQAGLRPSMYPPIVQLGPPTVSDGLRPEAVRYYLGRALPLIDDCYRTYSTRGTIASSRAVALEISPAGHATLIGGVGPRPELEACVALVVAATYVPEPTGGRAVKVVIPFLFAPPGSQGDFRYLAPVGGG